MLRDILPRGLHSVTVKEKHTLEFLAHFWFRGEQHPRRITSHTATQNEQLINAGWQKDDYGY